MPPCRNPTCTANLSDNPAHHLRWHPLCRPFYSVCQEALPQTEQTEQTEMLQLPPPQVTEDVNSKENPFYQKMRRTFMNCMNDLHYRERVGPTKCDMEAGRIIDMWGFVHTASPSQCVHFHLLRSFSF